MSKQLGKDREHLTGSEICSDGGQDRDRASPEPEQAVSVRIDKGGHGGMQHPAGPAGHVALRCVAFACQGRQGSPLFSAVTLKKDPSWMISRALLLEMTWEKKFANRMRDALTRPRGQ
jgi:hypothetical protein